MLMDIRECLLHDSKQQGLDGRRKTSLAIADERDPDFTAVSEFFHEPFYRGGQSDLIQKWRVQEMRKSTAFGETELDDMLQIVRAFFVDRRCVGNQRCKA